MYRWWYEGGGDRAWWVIESVSNRSPDKGFWACLGDLPPDMPRRPKTWVWLCNLMLKLRGAWSPEKPAIGKDNSILSLLNVKHSSLRPYHSQHQCLALLLGWPGMASFGNVAAHAHCSCALCCLPDQLKYNPERTNIHVYNTNNNITRSAEQSY